MPLAGVGEDLQRGELVGGLHLLLPELDDVDTPAQGGVEELFEVALLRPGVGAQVQPGGVESVAEWRGVLSHKAKPAMCIPK
ncbi:hypothetical protein GCM10009741_07790 [Kribbella lupini]|uniref:Uncharacterized protein n=1 Tax=Kribbella lupini TaxID=291602 RepID=A0ABP4KY74_9ACTN